MQGVGKLALVVKAGSVLPSYASVTKSSEWVRGPLGLARRRASAASPVLAEPTSVTVRILAITYLWVDVPGVGQQRAAAEVSVVRDLVGFSSFRGPAQQGAR